VTPWSTEAATLVATLDAAAAYCRKLAAESLSIERALRVESESTRLAAARVAELELAKAPSMPAGWAELVEVDDALDQLLQRSAAARAAHEAILARRPAPVPRLPTELEPPRAQQEPNVQDDEPSYVEDNSAEQEEYDYSADSYEDDGVEYAESAETEWVEYEEEPAAEEPAAAEYSEPEYADTDFDNSVSFDDDGSYVDYGETDADDGFDEPTPTEPPPEMDTADSESDEPTWDAGVDLTREESWDAGSVGEAFAGTVDTQFSTAGSLFEFDDEDANFGEPSVEMPTRPTLERLDTSDLDLSYNELESLDLSQSTSDMSEFDLANTDLTAEVTASIDFDEDDWISVEDDPTDATRGVNPTIEPPLAEVQPANPHTAAIQLTPEGAKVLAGPSEEDEEIALGAMDDYDDDFSDESSSFTSEGFGVAVVEYEDAESEEIDAPADPDPLRGSLSDLDAVPPQPVFSEKEIQAMVEDAERISRRDMSAGVDAWTDILDQSPEHIGALLNRGGLLMDLADYSGAMSDFLKAESIHPSNPEIHLAMGNLHFVRKDYNRALESFNRALDLNPGHALALCRRGIAQYQRKDYGNAVKDLERALKLDSRVPAGNYLSRARKRQR